jgi:predicted Zn-dependent protease
MNNESDFQILFNQKRFSEIIEKAKSLGIGPGTQPLLSKYVAGSYFSLGQYIEAENILVQLESSFFDDPNFLSLFAATSRRLSKFKRAERLFDKALSLQPDSLQLRNNYANLLIDLSQFEKARTLLQSVLQEQPSYLDAKDNLNRLDALEKEAANNENPSFNNSDSEDCLTFQDPLLFAFERSEVDHSLKRYKMRKQISSDSQLGLVTLPNPDARDVALEQIDAAKKALTENQPELVLKLCSQSLRVLGPNSEIYDLISDAYLNLKRYQDAETFLLHSVALEGISLKRCFNLVSFSMMRKDYLLANYYLIKASEIDPSSPDIQRLKSILNDRNSNQSAPFSFSDKVSL